MDEVKAEMNSRCCVGGIKCHCCNDFFGKHKPLLVRQARRSLKQKFNEELKEMFKDEENRPD